MTKQEETNEQQEQEKAVQEEPAAMSISEMELESLREEVRTYKDKYLRLLAESENSRKRLQKDRKEIITYAIENLLLDILHPIDHLENALGYTEKMSDEIKHWAHGFRMILTQFQDVLTNNGVKPIESLGKPFDPHFHEAVEMVVTTEAPEGTVIEENARGYMMGERTLRPARVKVAKKSEAEKEVEENYDQEVNDDKEEK